MGDHCTLHTLALVSMVAVGEGRLRLHSRTVPSSLPLAKLHGSACQAHYINCGIETTYI